MHPTILVKRKAEAVGRLMTASEALAKALHVDPLLITGLHPVGIRDAHVREMMLLEGVAELVAALASQADGIASQVSQAHWVESLPKPRLSAQAEIGTPVTAETATIARADRPEVVTAKASPLAAPKAVTEKRRSTKRLPERSSQSGVKK
jgi:hypothetical protein